MVSFRNRLARVAGALGMVGALAAPGFAADKIFSFTTGLHPDWEFAQIIPDPDTSVRLTTNSQAGSGQRVTLQARDTFGYLAIKDSTTTVLASPGTGRLLRGRWTVNSDGATGFFAPTFRLRTHAHDCTFTQEGIYQQISPIPINPIWITPPSGNFARTYDTLYFCNAALTNNNPDVASNGIILAFDVLQFGSALNGIPGTSLTLRRVEVDSIDPTILTGEKQVLDLSFNSSRQGFTPVNYVGTSGIIPATTNSSLFGGLSVQADSPPITDPSQPTGIRFCMGSWGRDFTTTEWPLNLNKVYKVDFTLASTSPIGTPSNPVRIRAAAGQVDFVGTAIVNAVFDQTFDPRGNGRTYTAFIEFPGQVTGAPVSLFFDVFRPTNSSGGIITLKRVVVTEFDDKI